MKADVAVVGAGPAGSATAILLASRGLDVALFDRASFPRDKPCGEFVNGRACEMVARLGVALDGSRVVSAVSLVAGTFCADGPIEPGRSIRRIELDQRLVNRAQEAGARFYPQHCVRAVENGRLVGDGFTCTAEVTVAADGTHSTLARRLGLVRSIPRLQRVGFVAHVTVDRPVAPGKVLLFGSTESDGIVGGLCMQGCRTAVLSCVLPKDLARRLDLHAFVSDRLSRWLGIGGRIEDAQTTTCFGHHLRWTHRDRVLFVGDAARFVDPFTGEGIHHALEGAFLAADVIASGYPLEEYGRRRKELELRYRVCDLVQFVVHHPKMLKRVVSRLAQRPDAAQRLFGILTDSLSPTAICEPRLLREVLA